MAVVCVAVALVAFALGFAAGVGLAFVAAARLVADRGRDSEPDADEQQWEETAERVGTPMHDYRGYE